MGHSWQSTPIPLSRIFLRLAIPFLFFFFFTRPLDSAAHSSFLKHTTGSGILLVFDRVTIGVASDFEARRRIQSGSGTIRAARAFITVMVNKGIAWAASEGPNIYFAHFYFIFPYYMAKSSRLALFLIHFLSRF